MVNSILCTSNTNNQINKGTHIHLTNSPHPVPPSQLTALATHTNFLFLVRSMPITIPKPFGTSGFCFLNCSSPGSLHGQLLFIFQASSQHFIISERISFTLRCRVKPSTLFFPIQESLCIPLIVKTVKTRFSCLFAYCYAHFHPYHVNSMRAKIMSIPLFL